MLFAIWFHRYLLVFGSLHHRIELSMIFSVTALTSRQNLTIRVTQCWPRFVIVVFLSSSPHFAFIFISVFALITFFIGGSTLPTSLTQFSVNCVRVSPLLSELRSLPLELRASGIWVSFYLGFSKPDLHRFEPTQVDPRQLEPDGHPEPAWADCTTVELQCCKAVFRSVMPLIRAILEVLEPWELKLSIYSLPKGC